MTTLVKKRDISNNINIKVKLKAKVKLIIVEEKAGEM